jgi:hypothetical protein
MRASVIFGHHHHGGLQLLAFLVVVLFLDPMEY